ncbi:MAG TPA: hypothetical protein VHM89_08755 [Acidimicrobiales bacterium]|nr:hypothetical protein [Acidimicrobiales bacterium]
MTARNVDAAIARLASGQHGVFARQQALAVGATGSLIQRRLASATWTAEAPGVYGLVGGVHTWHRRLMVAHLDLGPESVISHRAAAVLHGFAGMRPGAPEITVPRHRGRGGRWRVHQSALPPTAVRRMDHLPVTTIERTLVDLAGVTGAPQLASVIHHLLTDGRL